MKSNVKMIFRLNLIIMRLTGVYPPQKFKQLYKLYTYSVYVCFIIPLPVLAALHLIRKENVDMAEFGDSLFLIFQTGCFIFKLIPFIFNAEEVRKTIYMMDCPIFNTEKQEVILAECAHICKRNSLLFLGFVSFSCISWSLAPLFGGFQKFPVEVWLPFEVASDRKKFILVYVFISLAGCNGALSSGAIDPLVSGMACFATSQLRILKDNLENLSSYAEEELAKDFEHNINEKDNLKSKIIYGKIKTCIIHHNAVLKFIHHYERVYSSVAFSQFMAAGLVICVSCLRLSMVEPFTFTFFSMISFLFTMLLEIFLYCYFGTNLFNESNSLTAAIYMGTWYEYDLKSRKALVVLMERSKKPIIVTAGKILDLSLVTFTTILRRAYSLLAVLQNYQVDM